MSKNEEIAILAGGCFWCLEAVYQNLNGVNRVVSGYTGGLKQKPTYEEVCTDQTGHAEAVQIFFDPDVISYRELLEIFFTIHDPTTINRQGNDIGSQYRSAIFYRDEEQKKTAIKVIDSITAAKVYPDRLVTELKPFEIFYPAENYHQNYFDRNPDQLYCQAVISPKLSKFRQEWAQKLRN